MTTTQTQLTAVQPPRSRVRVEPSETRVCVLSGGWSDEREISRQSGEVCARALREAGFSVCEMDPADDGWIGRLVDAHVNVVFVAMHGRYGEDGCVQGCLELLGLPYTMSGVAAHALAMEKDMAKLICAGSGLNTPKGVTVAAGAAVSASEAAEMVERLGVPLIVKPVANGSSYGVSKVYSAAELPGAIATAAQGGQRVLVEQCIEGTEVTVPVLGNANPVALPVVEVVTGAEFYDLTVKYEPSELHHVIPARLDSATYECVQDCAVAAHVALGCAGCSRSDFIVTSEGVPYVLETNTIPGMTETSLLPDSARRAGIEFAELCRLLVEYGLEAHPGR